MDSSSPLSPFPFRFFFPWTLGFPEAPSTEGDPPAAGPSVPLEIPAIPRSGLMRALSSGMSSLDFNRILRLVKEVSFAWGIPFMRLSSPPA